MLSPVWVHDGSYHFGIYAHKHKHQPTGVGGNTTWIFSQRNTERAKKINQVHGKQKLAKAESAKKQHLRAPSARHTQAVQQELGHHASGHGLETVGERAAHCGL